MPLPSARRSLLALARSPLPNALLRALSLAMPAPVQRFARDAYRRVLRDFPLVAELLELGRVVLDGAGVQAAGARAPASAQPVRTPVVPPAVSAQPVRVAGVEPAAAAEPVAVATQPGFERLVAEVRGPSAEQAAAAVDRIAASGDPRAREVLLTALRNSDGYLHPLPRVAALRALARDPSPQAREAIVAAVSGVSAELSLAAIAALTEHAPVQALAPIRRVVDDRSGYFAPEVRVAAETALRKLQAQN
jgi:hypothetical protein